MIKYFAYILRVDSGFAPNPFFNFCTLATCKPKIRKKAQKGDWIFGLGSQKYRGRLIYAMKVTDKRTFDEYWTNKQFSKKKSADKSAKKRCGDNIYHTDSNGHWIQEKNPAHGKKHKERDIRGKFVLISDYFFYFGKNHIALPNSFKEETKNLRQGHKYIDKKIGEPFIRFLEKKSIGCHGLPLQFESDNKIENCRPENHKNNIIPGDFKSHKADCGYKIKASY